MKTNGVMKYDAEDIIIKRLGRQKSLKPLDKW